MTKKLFGTDGIRGRVGVPPVTAETFLHLGWALGRALEEQQSRVLVGRDTRLSSQMLYLSLSAGLLASGVEVEDAGVLPTPAIAYLTQREKCQAGLMVTASHNKFHDNGLKFFDSRGVKISTKLEKKIIDFLEMPLTQQRPAQLHTLSQPEQSYIDFLCSTLPSGTDLSSLKLIVDAASGAAHKVAQGLFETLGVQAKFIDDLPDGININDHCGATHPDRLKRAVIEHEADAGIALDGDADRLIMVDSNGQLLDGDDLLYILAAAHKQAGTLSGGVVGTVMTNMGQEEALAALSIPFERAAVGDVNVIEMMQALKWNLGGESSGHLISSQWSSTGDALLASLHVLSEMSRAQASLSQLVAPIQKYPQVLKNIPLDALKHPLDSPGFKEVCQAAEQKLGNEGRLLIRPSGTEPLVRIMVEAKDQALVDSLSDEIAMQLMQEESQLA